MFIKNYEIEQFGSFLMELKLKGSKSRMRTRMIRLLDERLQLINQERNSLLIDYAHKDENNEPIKETNENGEEYMSLENGEEYNREIEKLMLEDFIIEETPERQPMIEAVREVVLECDLEFSGVEAIQYDRWCEILEN